ncbi:MAG: NAD(P)/FAD-dependent oxidoreductase [Betaproteobacteria bacterium]
MRRRTFLELFAGAAVAGVPRLRAAANPRIVIAGGGILGTQIAYRLARRGAFVTLLEREHPAAGATANSFAWLNATYEKQPWAYFYLNRLGIEAWRALDAELPNVLPVRWGGSVEWYGDERGAAEFRERVRAHQRWGYPVALIDEAQLRALEPRITPGRVAAAAYAEDEGHVDPVGAVNVLIDQAKRAGARVRYPAEITGLDVRGGRLRAVRTKDGDVDADVLVIACGTDTPRVAAMAGLQVPLKPSPGVLVHTTPQQPKLGRVVLSPIAHMKQKPDGRIVTGSGFGGTPGTDTSIAAGERFLQTAATVLPLFGSMRVERVTLGWRPLPKDEYPVVGFPRGRRDLYITVMHSGMTLSPLIARLAATEILDGVDVDMLSPYRLERFVP